MPRKATRPKAIIWFERLSFGALALGAYQSWFAWYGLTPLPMADIRLRYDFVAAPVLIVAVIAALIVRVSRFRSKMAMWLLVGLFVLTLPNLVLVMVEGQPFASTAPAVIQLLGQLAALVLLFTRPARRWMNRESDIDLTDVFA